MAFHGGSQLFKNSKLLRTNNVVNYMEGPTKRQNIRDFKRSIIGQYGKQPNYLELNQYILGLERFLVYNVRWFNWIDIIDYIDIDFGINE